jgi:hypothetical protein
MKESLPPSTLFVLRFWLERSITGTRWRGRIEHIPGGSHGEFLGIKELLGFLQRFGIALDDTGLFERKEGLDE